MTIQRTWDVWTASLAGERIDHPPAHVQPGRYRFPEKVKGVVTHIGVAINPRPGGGLLVKMGKRAAFTLTDEDKEEDFAFKTFQYMAKRPITEAEYQAWMATETWPEEVKAPERKSNGQPHEIIAAAVADLLAEAKAWLETIGGKVETQDHADKAANYAGRFRELANEAEEARKKEKEPSLEEGRAIDKAWMPAKKAADEAKGWANDLATPFLLAEQKRKIAEAADRAAAGQGVRAKDLTVRAGTRGRATSLATTMELVFTDAGATFDHYAKNPLFRTHPDIAKIMGGMARRDIENGNTIPGVHLSAKTSAR